jgi:hypothetical protein
MSTFVKTVIPVAALAAGLMCISVTPSYAKPEYAKTEGKDCAFCHVTEGKPDLNEAGKFYAAHAHSLEGYTPAK